MSSSHVNLVTIFLETLLIFCLVLADISAAQSSCPRNKGTSRDTGELSRNPKLSSPEECARKCVAGEPPKTCYYHFTLENYVVGGKACELCTPNCTNAIKNNCQCVTADGVERTILTVNRMMPGPSIQVCQNDYVVIDVENHMQGMETTLHWHGIWQRGSQYYDGVPYVTQCPIQQGTTFRYQWFAENAGTHFWHSHSGFQKLDGIHGSIIVRVPPCQDPHSHRYDEDLLQHTILLSDWLHENAAERFPGRLKSLTGQTPQSVLINGKGQYRNRTDNSMTKTPLEVFEIEIGRRYRFRLINAMCSVCPAQWAIEGHRLKVIATDGEDIHPVKVDTIISFAGERYDFIIRADQPPGTYWIQFRALGECGEHQVQQLALLRYKGAVAKPRSAPPSYNKGLFNGVILNPLDAICDTPRKDAICVNHLKPVRPVDRKLCTEKPCIRILLPFKFHNYIQRGLYQSGTYNPFLVPPRGQEVQIDINGISYKAPSSVLISQIDDISKEHICDTNQQSARGGPPCECTHRIDIPLGCLVEVVLIDEMGVNDLSHPFHLHGYAFNVISMGRFPDQNVTKMTLEHVRELEKNGLPEKNWDTLPFKDTIAVPHRGYTIIRFHADNPGEWLLHCHFLFHIPIGMDVVLHVGERKDLPPVPKGFPKCGDFLPPIKNVSEKWNHVH